MIKRIKQGIAVVEQLRRGGVVNMNVLNYLEYEPNADILVFNDDLSRGLIVKFPDEEGYFVATNDGEFLSQFWSELDAGDKFFVCVPRLAAEVLISLSQGKTIWKSPCKTFIYDPEGQWNIVDDGKFPEAEMTLDDVLVVDEFYTYQNEGSAELFKKAVDAGYYSCVKADGEPVAWLLTHVEDGSLGPLYVKESHRGHKLGELVTSRLVKKLVKKGKTPFLHIVETNTAALGMLQKLPFKYTHDVVWFGLKK
ncbi:MAG: GNAT family N-acetyltransferase [Defluviitaleaceae bacterium]|nr:GNAT family N-acetyltransferase [Defluviitaleaceae bacterium]